ncbi:helix-turn-helix transcriptional regulator [Desulfovibrio sp. TomC]|uniref:helix-turn-helix transcriptional regulator n=1 Tax=Desulfovibrio sp. TomC TaxID=1562888 RepID=UPI00057392C3|nr:helix-turn-helix domain-containing protein [Desulfovibrio sp. TomC]KHK04041.1 hypothetical protein NY78_0483 [Desulfovibrio sp. TomC]
MAESLKIVIESVQNGVVVDASGRRMVYELCPGRRTQAMHDLLLELAGILAARLEVRIEVRDRDGEEAPVEERPVKLSLTQEDVETLYGIPHKTLEDWRCSGKGPRYIKPGKRVYYLREDIEAFMNASAVVTTGRV